MLEARATSNRRGAVVVGMILLLIVGAISAWFLKPDSNLVSGQRPVRRIAMNLERASQAPLDAGRMVGLSPDESTLAFIGQSMDDAGEHQLYLKPLDQLEANALPSTRGADYFCFSPDSHWIAFRDRNENKLKKVAILGGNVMTLCQADKLRGLDWGEDNSICFAENASGILRVSSVGGEVEELTARVGQEMSHRWPHFLPDAKAVIYCAHIAHLGWSNAEIMIKTLPDGVVRTLGIKGHSARYLRSGYLVYMRRGTLHGVVFDMDTLLIKGPPIPLVEEIRDDELGGSFFDLSTDGTLVYRRGLTEKSPRQLTWIDRDGNREIFLPEDDYGQFRLSPDAGFLAYLIRKEKHDIWIYDLARAVPSKLTHDPGHEMFPIWSPGGETIAFAYSPSGPPNIYWTRADGTMEARRLLGSPSVQFPVDWHPDGDKLIIYEETTEGEKDQRILHLQGDDQSGWTAEKTEDFLSTRHNEMDGSFSPNGHWIAYSSDESGQRQVYVRRFPDGGGKRQISLDDRASSLPKWSRASKELLFGTRIEIDSSKEFQVHIVKYSENGNSFLVERPMPWQGAIYSAHYDLHPDGKSLLVSTSVGADVEQDSDQIILFENFDEFVNRQVAASKK